ncbi:DUF523 domain-containing protein [Patescibacteria group bacterium]
MTEIKTDKPIIVSMCLAGVPCNYKGESAPCQQVIDLVDQGRAILVCPEQLGGLSTPRTPAEKSGIKVIARDGTDVTEEFETGAERTLKIAQQTEAEIAILKARSPSCGKGIIYDGSHTGSLTEGNGLTAGLLLENGIKVLTEEEI